VAVDNRKRDTRRRTYRDIGERLVGGWSGGALPNSISLLRFRSIAGCCVGTAPQALQIVWDRVASYRRKRLTVNLPVERELRQGAIEIGYPNEGFVRVTPRRACDVAIRLHPWMPDRVQGLRNGKPSRFERDGRLAVFRGLAPGDTVEIRHVLRTRRLKEHVFDGDYTGIWRGPDMVDLLPRGEPLRLYQRVEGKRKVYPRPTKKGSGGKGFEAKPTQQKTTASGRSGKRRARP
jgi:hypothetical protein